MKKYLKYILIVPLILITIYSARIVFWPTQVEKCIKAHLGILGKEGYEQLSNDPDIQEKLKEQGLETLYQLIEKNCQYFVRNGEIFDQ